MFEVVSIIILLICITAFFGIEPYINCKKENERLLKVKKEQELLEQEMREKEQRRKDEELFRIAREQEEKEIIAREKAIRVAKEKGYKVYNETAYVRGGHGNQRLIGWEVKREVIYNDKDN